MTMSRFEAITDSIFMSDWNSSVNPTILRKNNIKFILCVNHEGNKTRFLPMYKEMGITHKYVDLEDVFNADLHGAIDQSIDFMKNEIRGNVLVHCNAGASRSSPIVIAFLMYKAYAQKSSYGGKILNRTLKFVRKKYPCEPSRGFMGQLAQYEIKLMD